MASKMDLIAAPGAHLVRITPPQTNDIPDFAAGKGAYCFVIDVSGSMHAAAQVTTDDGDKVNHGWSQLDIAKHSTNTFISSLGDDDFICVVTYSDGANVSSLLCCVIPDVHIGWIMAQPFALRRRTN